MNNRGMIAFLILGMTSAPVFAQEIEQPEAFHQSIVNLIKQFADNGMLSKEASEQLLNEAEPSAPANVAAPSGVAAKEAAAKEAAAKEAAAKEAAAKEAAAKEAAAKEAAAREAAAKEAAAKEAAARETAARETAARETAVRETAAKEVAATSGVVATDVPVQNGTPSKEPVKPEVVHVRYVPEVVRQEIKEEIKQEVLAQAKAERWGDPGALPDWLNRISWDGDFRLRYERDGFPSGNALPNQLNPGGGAPNGLTLIGDTTDTHNYMLIQARLNMKAVVSDNTFADFRFTTGTVTNPDSANQTLGTGFNKSALVIDRAYVQSTPYNWLTLIGGKMPNPWLSTDLVWDSDVDFEGVASQFKSKMSDQLNGFVTVGAFPYQNILKSDTVLASNKWLYAAQLSGQWTSMDSSTAQFGVALYDFLNVEGIPNATLGSHLYDNTAPQSMQKGNSLMNINANGDPNIYGLASKFRELDLTAKMDWATFDPVHVMLSGDFVRNLGYNSAVVNQLIGAQQTAEVIGYQALLTVGKPRVKKRGDWQTSFAYKYIQRDAVLDALNDQDFHLGGTNAKGYLIRASYGLDKETSVVLNWFSTDQIDGPPLSVDTLQLDLNVKF